MYQKWNHANPFVRDIQKELYKWKDSKTHQALQLESLLQIGKTTVLPDTFKEESRNYFSSPREVEIFDMVYQEAIKEMCNEKKGSGKNIIDQIATLVFTGFY